MKGLRKAENLINAACDASYNAAVVAEQGTCEDYKAADRRAVLAKAKLLRHVRALRVRERRLTDQLRTRDEVQSRR